MVYELWDCRQPKLDWDEPVPKEVEKNNITQLASIKIPKWIQIGIPHAVSDLRGFADALQNAYAATIFVRTILPTEDICAAAYR